MKEKLFKVFFKGRYRKIINHLKFNWKRVEKHYPTVGFGFRKFCCNRRKHRISWMCPSHYPFPRCVRRKPAVFSEIHSEIVKPGWDVTPDIRQQARSITFRAKLSPFVSERNMTHLAIYSRYQNSAFTAINIFGGPQVSQCKLSRVILMK